MRTSNTLWWLHPAAPMLLIHLPLLMLSFLLPEWVYASLWRSPKYLDMNAAGLSAAMILAWLVGFFLLKRTDAPTSQGRPGSAGDEIPNLRHMRRLFNLSMVLTIAGYAI